MKEVMRLLDHSNKKSTKVLITCIRERDERGRQLKKREKERNLYKSDAAQMKNMRREVWVDCHT